MIPVHFSLAWWMNTFQRGYGSLVFSKTLFSWLREHVSSHIHTLFFFHFYVPPVHRCRENRDCPLYWYRTLHPVHMFVRSCSLCPDHHPLCRGIPSIVAPVPSLNIILSRSLQADHPDNVSALMTNAVRAMPALKKYPPVSLPVTIRGNQTNIIGDAVQFPDTQRGLIRLASEGTASVCMVCWWHSRNYGPQWSGRWFPGRCRHPLSQAHASPAPISKVFSSGATYAPFVNAGDLPKFPGNLFRFLIEWFGLRNKIYGGQNPLSACLTAGVRSATGW